MIIVYKQCFIFVYVFFLINKEINIHYVESDINKENEGSHNVIFSIKKKKLAYLFRSYLTYIRK